MADDYFSVVTRPEFRDMRPIPRLYMVLATMAEEEGRRDKAEAYLAKAVRAEELGGYKPLPED